MGDVWDEEQDEIVTRLRDLRSQRSHRDAASARTTHNTSHWHTAHTDSTPVRTATLDELRRRAAEAQRQRAQSPAGTCAYDNTQYDTRPEQRDPAWVAHERAWRDMQSRDAPTQPLQIHAIPWPPGVAGTHYARTYHLKRDNKWYCLCRLCLALPIRCGMVVSVMLLQTC